MKKRFLSLILVVALSLSLCVTASAAPAYDPAKALEYARNHWNDENNLKLPKRLREVQCAEFVSDCLRVGGLSSWHAHCRNLYNQLTSEAVNSGIATLHYLQFSNHKIRVADNAGKVAPGDVLFWLCRYCGPNGTVGIEHTAIVSDVSGEHVRIYAHHEPKNNEEAYVGNCWECGRPYAYVAVFHFNQTSGKEKITTPTEGQKGELWELVFNTNVYYNNYGDLRDAFSYNPSALRNHWEIAGKAEGRTASALFDAGYYLNNNSDVAEVFGRENYWWALWHFVNYGFWEGRQGSPYFCAGTYLNNYGDLRDAFGENQLEAAKHYVTCGIKEGRVASADGNKFNATLLDPPAAQSLPGNPYQYSSAPTRALYYTSRVMTGNDVKWVQAALNLYGNYGLDIDGSFGPATRNATMQFQRSIGGLAVDGSFGPATRAKMISWLASRGYNG